ncbi:MAG: BlaI/MecI/CopY family transcriptional regulator [Clostridiaceae bacterium]
MKNVPSISDAEWEVMKIIWGNNNITANKIIEETGVNNHWKSNTVKTLINRLLKKNAVGFNKNGKEYSYFPMVSEEDCINEKNQSFLKKIYNGSLNSMVLNFVKTEKLTDKEIEDLKDLLNKSKK